MYFPKSQITTGLYTNGSEFVISTTGEGYQGPYWKTSTGRFYTGAQPSAPNVQQLTKAQQNSVAPAAPEQPEQVVIITSQTDYLAAKNITPTTIEKPQHSANIPTNEQYMVGEFRRFFCKAINQEQYLEISQQTYNRLVSRDPTILWQYYITFEMPWTLTGEERQVYNTNRNITQLTAKRNNAINLAQFLKNDYLKYYKG